MPCPLRTNFQQIRLLDPGLYADQLAANWSGSTLFAKTGYVVFSKRKVKQQYSELWEWISRTKIKEEFKVSKLCLLSVIMLKQNYQD